MMPSKDSNEFLRLKEIVDRCRLKTPADVEEFFDAYTKYIWDHKMIGSIYDHYPDDIVIKLENGDTLEGIDDEVNGCIFRLNNIPGLRFVFLDIMAHKVSNQEFKFIQVTTYEKTAATGPSPYGEPATDIEIGPDNFMTMCECLVKKVNGRWIIADEWIISSSKRWDAVRKGYIF